MTESPQTLADLINSKVGRRGHAAIEAGRLTFEQFSQLAVDPESNTRITVKTAWKLSRGERVLLTPEMVVAIAVGLDVPLVVAQAAAAYTVTGLNLAAQLDAQATGESDPYEVDAMSWDPIPDEHSADLMVTMSGAGPMTPEEKQTLLDIVRLKEQGLPIPTRLDDDG